VPKAAVGIPLITARNVREGRLDFSVTEYVDAAAYPFWKKRGSLLPGDVLFTTEAPLGMVALYPPAGEYAIGQRIVAMRPKSGVVCGRYLLQFLLSPLGQRRIDDLATGSTAKGISSAHLRQLVIEVPPLKEQEKVAECLAEWDHAIRKTEQLLAAKELELRALRQRAFRTCALSRIRLDSITRRVTRKNIAGDGQPLTISGSDGLVAQSSYYGKRIAAVSADHYTLLRRGEFAYNRSSSTGYPLGAIKRLDSCDEGIVSSLYLCFALDSSVSSDYFVQFCEAGGFNHQLYEVAQEGARNHGLLSVTVEDFFGMSMPLPPRDEQERVVRVLGAATRELSLLRDTVRALRAQKRGLMQKLLTGQWRLPVPEQEPT
jgi:type I restriction enzyme S subunit